MKLMPKLAKTLENDENLKAPKTLDVNIMTVLEDSHAY